MAWRRKKEDNLDPPGGAQGPLNDREPGDWIVVPFRLAEVARQSIYTIGSHPELPEHARYWIASWLTTYNHVMSSYFREVYGPDIFDLLKQITEEVKASSQKEPSFEEDFAKWKEEIEHGREDGQ